MPHGAASHAGRFPSLSCGLLLRILRYKDEHSFKLSEYMVVLDKPLGLSLAPDPTGQVKSLRDAGISLYHHPHHAKPIHMNTFGPNDGRRLWCRA